MAGFNFKLPASKPAKVPQVSGPARAPNFNHDVTHMRPPRLKPIKTRDYTKGSFDPTDPSQGLQFGGGGFGNTMTGDS